MPMTLRENTMAILNYKPYDYFPLVHFGFWDETVEKWANEGRFSKEKMNDWGYITKLLGFDFGWAECTGTHPGLKPSFEPKIIERTADGYIKELDYNGVINLKKEGVISIPSEIDHLLKDRESWEEHYKWRFQFSPDRVDMAALAPAMDETNREVPVGIFCGSLFGAIRDMMGVVGVSYLYSDDEDLYDEIIDTVGRLCFDTVKAALDTGAKFDYAHFWEDICFKNGPLVIPNVFREKVGPHYKRITRLLNDNGVNIVSLDCDGCIDALLPIWLENGVNTMFPIEVGTWDASIGPWREKYGREIRGVGGMNKTVFAEDTAAIDKEIDRLIGLIDLGGYIPCPDHRIAPDAKWENVIYYCAEMRRRLAGR